VAAVQPILEVRNLTKYYGFTAAVHDLSLEMYPGETLTLLGPSGCGKSTTLRAIAGLERPEQGEILVNGTMVFSSARRVFVAPEKRNMGLVFQSYAIWPHMTVAQNVGYPLKIRRTPDHELRARVHRALGLVGLEMLADRPATQLSGGQQQRVALARSLVYEPDILLLDEPLSNLDAALRQEVRVQIKQLQAELGTTILFVTHDQVEAMSLSTKLAVMNAGRIEQLGTPQEVYEQPATPFVEDFIGRVLRFRGSVAEQTDEGPLVELAGTPGVRLRTAASDEPVSVGTEVQVAIRPEDLQVHDGAGANVLRCSVEKVLYLGAECELLLRFGDVTYTHVLSRGAVADLGSTVDLYLPPRRLRVWPERRIVSAATEVAAAMPSPSAAGSLAEAAGGA
jgi:ABC-type Fe3+/spermidine/putrescine transport system ATPase subunit